MISIKGLVTTSNKNKIDINFTNGIYFLLPENKDLFPLLSLNKQSLYEEGEFIIDDTCVYPESDENYSFNIIDVNSKDFLINVCIKTLKKESNTTVKNILKEISNLKGYVPSNEEGIVGKLSLLFGILENNKCNYVLVNFKNKINIHNQNAIKKALDNYKDKLCFICSNEPVPEIIKIKKEETLPVKENIDEIISNSSIEEKEEIIKDNRTLVINEEASFEPIKEEISNRDEPVKINEEFIFVGEDKEKPTKIKKEKIKKVKPEKIKKVKIKKEKKVRKPILSYLEEGNEKVLLFLKINYLSILSIVLAIFFSTLFAAIAPYFFARNGIGMGIVIVFVTVTCLIISIVITNDYLNEANKKPTRKKMKIVYISTIISIIIGLALSFIALYIFYKHNILIRSVHSAILTEEEYLKLSPSDKQIFDTEIYNFIPQGLWALLQIPILLTIPLYGRFLTKAYNALTKKKKEDKE